MLGVGRGVALLLHRCEEVVSIPCVDVNLRIEANNFRFTGPKMTLSEEDLTDEQQEALKNEGLEVNIEPRGTDGTQNAPISKDIESS